MRHVAEYPPAKLTREYPSDIFLFFVLRKLFKGWLNAIAPIWPFDLRTVPAYFPLNIWSVPRSSQLSFSFAFRKENVRYHECIFAPIEGYCLRKVKDPFWKLLTTLQPVLNIGDVAAVTDM